MNAPAAPGSRASGSGFDPDCECRLETLGLVAEGVAHDFNNILATIAGFAELILNSDGEPSAPPRRVNGFARHILEAALAGQTSVRELQGFARRGSKGMEPLDLHEVLRKSLSLCRGALGGGVRVRASLADFPARLAGCRGLLQNAFLNLFINARDAMPKGGLLIVRTWRHDDDAPDAIPTLVVSIRDTGTGMSEAVRNRLFERYFTTKGQKGSGLGLAQVRETVERHGGRITVESAPGEGTEFRLYFPLDAGR